MADTAQTPTINLRGVGTALVTPFTPGGEAVDYAALDRLVDAQIASGASYLVVLGTTGEAVTLTPEERLAVSRRVAERAAGRLPLVLGFSGNATAHLCQELRRAPREGFTEGYSAVLSVVPFYNKPSQEGMRRHFSAVAEASPLPLILYNVPGRTGANMESATTLALAHDYPGRVIGIKEASGRLGQIREIIERKPRGGGFQVVSGDDALTLPLIALGAEGVISVAANGVPGPFCRMVSLSLQGRFHEASPLDRMLQPLYRLLFAEGNPSGIKAFLEARGICRNTLRLPLTPVSDTLAHALALLARSLPAE